MKKKLVSILMASMLAFTYLSGCTGQDRGGITPDADEKNDPVSVEKDQEQGKEAPADVDTDETAETDVTDNTETYVSPFAGMTPEEITASLTLEQKAYQMVQGAVYELPVEYMGENDYGSVLSRFDTHPQYTCDEWVSLIDEYQDAALASEAGIPFVYGNDSVHGVNFASDTVIFPQNINIGAADDPELTYEMGKHTAADEIASCMIFNFAPCVAAAQDPRWGRTYESISSDPELVKKLSLEFTKGLVESGTIACPKHFIGEGYTQYGTGEKQKGVVMPLDRGDTKMTDEQLEANLAIYKALIDAGAQTVMISHSSFDGVKMHENKDLIDKIKNDMGFTGFIISDWDSVHNCSGETFYDNMVLAVNVGIDMFMEAEAYDEAAELIVQGVNEGRISEERVDDAVCRIIKVKQDAGLFDDPYLKNLKKPECSMSAEETAFRLAYESMVPLKDDAGLVIPDGSKIFVTGPAADDTGAQCGGWTYTWLASSDADFGDKWVPSAKTYLDGLNEKASSHGWEIITDESRVSECDYVVLCVGEVPYAEWYGDTEDLSITGSCGLDGNKEAIAFAKASGKPVITLITAGRNVIISDYEADWDSVIMCYLPGCEGGSAAAALLSGEQQYSGKLPMPYYSSVDQIGTGKYLHPVGWNCLQD